MDDFKLQLFSFREKRGIALIAVAAVVLGVSAISYLSARPAPPVTATAPTPRPTPYPLKVLAYSFVSPAAGWVAIRAGNDIKVMRTADGGAKWAPAGPALGTADLVQLTFFDRLHGLVVLRVTNPSRRSTLSPLRMAAGTGPGSACRRRRG